MSLFDTLINDVASRFGLGDKAGTLIGELMKLIAETPGGLGGFIDKFRSAGLSREIGSWLGNANAGALSASEMEQVLGRNTIESIASDTGMPATTASAALGYVAPKLIGWLTPGGAIAPGIPQSVMDYLHAPAAGAAYQDPASRPQPSVPRDITVSQASNRRAWALPVLAALGLGGLGWYLLSNPSMTPVATTSAPGSAPTTSGAGSDASTSTIPSRLSLRNDNGVITVSGTVRSQSERQSILEALHNTFGSNAVKGDITVNQNAAPVPWLANLPQALAQLKVPGLEAAFEGTSLNLSGPLTDAERDRIITAMRSLFGASGLSLGALDLSGLAAEATNKASAALAALGPRFQTTDLLDILNGSIINFPTGSADIPVINRTLLQQAAERLRQLPAGTVIEIAGFTDNTGDPAANIQLSERRAQAVKLALTQAGVSQGMLTAKGYGSADPVASNDTPEGRFQNRRISYRMSGSKGTVGSGN